MAKFHKPIANRNRRINGPEGYPPDVRDRGDASDKWASGMSANATNTLAATSANRLAEAALVARPACTAQPGRCPPTTPMRTPTPIPAPKNKLKAVGRLRSVVSAATTGETQTAQTPKNSP